MCLCFFRGVSYTRNQDEVKFRKLELSQILRAYLWHGPHFSTSSSQKIDFPFTGSSRLPFSTPHLDKYSPLSCPASTISERTMAASTRAMYKASASIGRASLTRPTCQLVASQSPISRVAQVQRQFRRSYADVAPIVVKPRRRFRPLRTAWRLTWISALAGVSYMAWSVYELRNPENQFEPDPTKKNLVILGRFVLIPRLPCADSIV